MEPASSLTTAALAAATLIVPCVDLSLNVKNESERIVGVYIARQHFPYSSGNANTCMISVEPEPIDQVIPGCQKNVPIFLGTDFKNDFQKRLSIIAPTGPDSALELRFYYKKLRERNYTFFMQYFQRHISASLMLCRQMAEKEVKWEGENSIYVFGEITVENKSGIQVSDALVRLELEAIIKQKII